MKISLRRPVGLVFALVLAGAALAACSNSPSTPSGSGGTTPTAAGGNNGSAPTTQSPGATTTTSGAPRNLAATAAVKASITAVYVAARNLPASQVAGTAPGTVYYAYVPSTQTYWAIAGFEPNGSATMQTQVAMQDDGCCGIFTQTAGGNWTFVSGYLGEPCTGQIPASLMALWGLQPPGDCAPAATTTT
ncbi:MAG TPA: hypothetical protein VNG12_10970 [Acidimicrobiales bacterium]|nr:hypothetical protein [Acidimicrobiales bacterium]